MHTPQTQSQRGPFTFAIVAPSGATDTHALDRAVARIEALGHFVIVEPETRESWRYFAGTDEARLAALHRALEHPNVDVVMSTRGGYGLSRLLDKIDWSLVEQANKWLCGFSDFTALNFGALSQSKLISFHGPSLTSDFAWKEDESPDLIAAHHFTEQSFFAALRGEKQSIEVTTPQSKDMLAEAADAGSVIHGVLWGGNLSMVAHLAGSRYWPSEAVRGGILFLEEITEDPYRIERMLYQLKFAGAFLGCQAIVLGQFTKCGPNNTARYPYALSEALETLRGMTDCPIFTDFPFGHVAKKATLQIGAPCTIKTLNNGYRWEA